MTIAIGIISTALILQAQAEQGQNYENPQFGISLNLPNGWRQIHQSTVEQHLAARLKHDAKVKPNWIAAFQYGQLDPFTCPYVVLQAIEYSYPPSEEEMRDLVEAMSKVNVGALIEKNVSSDAKNALGKAKLGSAWFDSKHWTFETPIQIKVPDIGDVEGVIFGQFGSRALIQIMCYSTAAEFQRCDDDFRRMQSSFQFSSNAAYSPPTIASGKNAIPDRLLAKAVVGAVSGAVLATILVVFGRTKKSAQSN
jgi:hypothetical protein